MSDLDIEPFEVLWDDDGGESTEQEYPLLGVGVHTLQIKNCEIVPGHPKFAQDEKRNKKGLCLKFTLAKKGHKFVWADVPMHWRGLIESTYRAASVELPKSPEDISPVPFVGQFVNVEIGHYHGKNGDGTNVVKWLPGREATPTKKPTKARESTGQKLTKEYAHDDIPF